jgi:hypothetical protein
MMANAGFMYDKAALLEDTMKRNILYFASFVRNRLVYTSDRHAAIE